MTGNGHGQYCLGIEIRDVATVGQNGTDICLKLKVKVGKIWSKFEIKNGQSYQIVRNFNNF